MDKKTKAGIVIRFVLIALCLVGVIIALSLNLDFLKEAGQNAESAGEAIGEAIGMSLAAMMVLVLAIIDMGAVSILSIIGIIFSARKIAVSIGKVRVISIVQTAVFGACILTVIVKFLTLILLS